MELETTTIDTPTGQMDEIEGYEELKTNDLMMSPPPSEEGSPISFSRSPSLTTYPKLTKEVARDALLDFVYERYCYGLRAAREMTIEHIEHSTTFHYTLQTFGEKREFLWKCEPFIGQDIDSPRTDQAPTPWDVVTPKTTPFVETTAKMEVPHTASVKPCPECNSSGQERCSSCFGCGQTVCTNCNGFGYESSRTCKNCSGWGTNKCSQCMGTGQSLCSKCAGTGHLKCYIQLKCQWKNHIDECTVESPIMPTNVVHGVISQVLFEEDLPRVWPIDNFPDPAINEVSARLIDEHHTLNDTEKIVRQRQTLHVIPIAKVHYVWRGRHNHFFVYGFENDVYAPDYPQKNFWGCCVY